MHRILKIAVLALVLSACADNTVTRVTEYLDPDTAVTIRAVSAPIVFSHDAPELAANARDYLSAGLVEVNNMGKRVHYLALVSWSTVDRRRPGTTPAVIPGRVELLVAGKPREFTPVTHEPRTLGIGTAPFRPASGYAGESWYQLSVEDLRALSADPPRSLALTDDATNRVGYELWRAATEELREFVRDVPDSPKAEPPRR